MVHWLMFQLECYLFRFWHSQAASDQSQLQNVLYESEYEEYNPAEEPQLVFLAERVMIFGTLKLFSEKLHVHNFAFTPNVNMIKRHILESLLLLWISFLVNLVKALEIEN